MDPDAPIVREMKVVIPKELADRLRPLAQHRNQSVEDYVLSIATEKADEDDRRRRNDT